MSNKCTSSPVSIGVFINRNFRLNIIFPNHVMEAQLRQTMRRAEFLAKNSSIAFAVKRINPSGRYDLELVGYNIMFFR